MILATVLLAATIATKADVPRLSAPELHALVTKGEAVVIDVRGSVPFKYGHIAGATSMPLGAIAKRFGELPQDKTIVSYCTCRSEETSLEAAMMLSQTHGFPKVAVLVGGMAAWKDAGYATEATRTVEFSAESPAVAAGSAGTGGRLAPPAAVGCDRNQLTSYAGRVIGYRRTAAETRLLISTSAGTVEKLYVRHGDAPLRSHLMDGQIMKSEDWSRVESEKGELREMVSAIAWVCADGTTVVDWRPGVVFEGAE
jgi:rhodanese-related sulfurtransferase